MIVPNLLHPRVPRYALLLLCAWSLLLAPLRTAAQELPPPAAEETPATAEEIPVPAEHRSAQATMRTFLESFLPPQDLPRAAGCLDLSNLPPNVRAASGRELAVQLKAILDRTALIRVEDIPDQATGQPYQLAVGVDGEVVVAPTERGEWLFTTATVAAVPELFRAVEDRALVEGVIAAELTPSLWLRSRMPEALRHRGWLLEHWQWLGLLVILFAAGVVKWLVATAARFTVMRYFATRLEQIDPQALAQAMQPVGLLAAALVSWAALLWLGLPAGLLAALILAARFTAITAFVWAAYRLVDLFTTFLASRAGKTDTKYDDLLVPLIRKSLKILIAAFGLLFIADNFNLQITSLLAGLGIGGIAIALAAKDTVQNIFGSLTVLIDRPFHVGDSVVIGDVQGTVVEVGFRSTRIRTFYDSLITLPNANLINTAVDNYGARQYRRWNTKLSLPYNTPAEKVEAFCEGVRELIRQHPDTRKEAFHVYLNDLAASSIDVLLYVFFAVPDWAAELRGRHQLALDILRLAASLDVELAFPTQTLYLHRPESPAPLLSAADYGARVASAKQDGSAQARALIAGSGTEANDP